MKKMSSNPSLVKGGLPVASAGHPVLGLFVQMIDRNGQMATGFLEHYDETLDTFDVILFNRKAEVTQITDQSASGRFGDFGGTQIQTVPTLRVQGAVYIGADRIGQPRFILSGEDPQQLLDWLSAANKAAESSLEATRQALEQKGSDQAAKPDGAGGNVVEGAKIPGSPPGPPAPEPVGKTTPPPHPDIELGKVEEPETPAIPPEQQKGRLPDGFPGLAALSAVGIVKFKDLRKRLQKNPDLTAISGIGQVTADKIKSALGG